jgi:hypothetical protein
MDIKKGINDLFKKLGLTSDVEVEVTEKGRTVKVTLKTDDLDAIRKNRNEILDELADMADRE